MHPPLPAEAIFNAIPFGLIFVEDGTIRHANEQAHTILRRLYLESTTISEVIPDYEQQFRHTVVVENVPILAHIFPMSATTQAVVVRYAIFELPIVHERFVQTVMDGTTAIIEHLETLDQTEFNEDQQQGFQTIQQCAFGVARILSPLVELKHILSKQHISQKIDLSIWLPQRLERWQAQAISQEIGFEVQYDQGSSFMMIEPALHILIDELLMRAFTKTPTGGQIRLNITSTTNQLLINVYDSGPLPTNEDWFPWHSGSINLWTAWLGANVFYTAITPIGKTFTIDISLPLPTESDRNFPTLNDLLECMPLPLKLEHSNDKLGWNNSQHTPIWSNQIAASNEQIRSMQANQWFIQAEKTSQPIYLIPQGFNLLTVQNVCSSDINLQIGDASSLIETELRSIITHEVISPLTPIYGFANILRLGYMGAMNPDNSSVLARIAELCSHLRDTLLRYIRIIGRIHQERHHICPSNMLKSKLENTARIFDDLCTDRQITLHLEISSFSKSYAIDLNDYYCPLHAILENAIQAAPIGTQVTLRAHEFENGMLIQIHDHGAGIPEAERAQMYDFFWRNPHNYVAPLDEPRLGIGLALANIIVRAAGGWMKHECTADGTTSTVWLPWIDIHE